jgi:hypothetical protein
MQHPEASIIVHTSLGHPDPHIPQPDRAILRRLAGELAALAARPIEAEKRDLWRKHNALQPTRPLVFCDPENSWNEIITADQLECTSALARQWEWLLRREIFWSSSMGDDRTLDPHFDVPHVHAELDWGLKEQRIGGHDGGAYRWDPPIKTAADLDKLHPPLLRVDFDATNRMANLADEILGDLLPVRVKTSWWWSVGMTRTLAELRGLEQIMYDMVDAPALIHRLMAALRDGTLALIEALEAQGLLSLNNDSTYVGSGGLGWSDELPQPDFDGHVRLCDMWGFAESQETVGISPSMFAEFVLPYQLPLLARFGLNCYGCCEPLDRRWPVVRQIPNLRRVSVSPWSDRARMAESLGDRYVFSMKPNPADLALDTFDEARIRATLRDDLRAARGCRVEIVMKDNHTIRRDPTRVIRWVHIAREEAENI